MDRGINELGGVKLTASWETVVGSVGEFTHVLEYEGYKGFDETSRALRTDQVSLGLYNDLAMVCAEDLSGDDQAQFGYSPQHHLEAASDHF